MRSVPLQIFKRAVLVHWFNLKQDWYFSKMFFVLEKKPDVVNN